MSNGLFLSQEGTATEKAVFLSMAHHYFLASGGSARGKARPKPQQKATPAPPKRELPKPREKVVEKVVEKRKSQPRKTKQKFTQKKFEAPPPRRVKRISKVTVAERETVLNKIEAPRAATTYPGVGDRAPLAEKYRPFHVSDSVGNREIAEELIGAITLGEIPYAMIFFGPPGVGKTSEAKAFSRDYMIANGVFDKEGKQVQGVFDPVLFLDRPMKVEDMDRGGIVDNFMSYLPPSENVKRVLVVDEADRSSRESILRFRQDLEKHGNNTITIFTSNEPPSEWLDPNDLSLRGVQSRMRMFEFKSPTEKDMATRLKEIAQAEKIKASDEDLLKMTRDAELQGDYDIRKAVDNLARFQAREAGREMMRK